MSESKQQMGVVGLDVMGRNLARNFASRGIPTAVYNRTTSKMESLIADHADEGLSGYAELADFVAALERPRRILLMVKAGRPVDLVLDSLLPLLEEGDIVADGGNSKFRDTSRRAERCASGDSSFGGGIRFFGVGISGGEEGALLGPAMMPGGDEQAWGALRPHLEAAAAVSSAGPCVGYCGRGGAGHFVKMVHNGIEYADMQLIAEVYDLLRNGFHYTNAEIAALFDEWRSSKLASYLIDITADIVAFADDQGGEGELIDKIVDVAGNKGTGRWTVQEALELGMPIPTIGAAVDARLVSALKEEREQAEKIGTGGYRGRLDLDPAGRKEVEETLRRALYAAKIACYAQGMAMIRAASVEHDFGTDLGEVPRIWMAGCIIRAELLGAIREAYQRTPDLPNLLLDETIGGEAVNGITSLQRVAGWVATSGLGAPALMSALSYLLYYRRARVPANIIQAQRDYFGAHTYQRTDKEGTFHTEWLANKGE